MRVYGRVGLQLRRVGLCCISLAANVHRGISALAMHACCSCRKSNGEYVVIAQGRCLISTGRLEGFEAVHARCSDSDLTCIHGKRSLMFPMLAQRSDSDFNRFDAV